MQNADPPVIITNGSITIDLNPKDFPNLPPRIRNNNVRIAAVVIEDGKGNSQTVTLADGFRLIFHRA